ncbi:MAG: DUF2974 domain-containing protein [Lachnospiraceae bacterium]|nr:DUF2974 domain-containing protein [Lachnospiraceae bacterium]
MNEEEISLILDTYMYLDNKEAKDGMCLSKVIEKLADAPDCMEGGCHYEEYQILSKAVQNPEIGELIIGNQSHLMGFDSGTAACTFRTKDSKSVYVVYRGTADGEWVDNAVGMTEAETIQQKRALSYFDTVVNREELKENERLVITGHSKGGNKAQFVTMSSKYADKIDACYNVDGQGFSEKAIEKWKQELGNREYENRRNKITGIYGENDYVNVLGHSIVSEDNVYYIRTPADKKDFAGYHDITYMFAKRIHDTTTGSEKVVFDACKNDYAPGRGIIGNYVSELSGRIMDMPRESRDGCAAFMMQIMELTKGRGNGINGEVATLSDVNEFCMNGIPMICNSLLFSGEGALFLDAALCKDSFALSMQGNVNFEIDTDRLRKQAATLINQSILLESVRKELETIIGDVKKYMKTEPVIYAQLLVKEAEIRRNIRLMEEKGKQLYSTVYIYEQKDEEASLFFE